MRVGNVNGRAFAVSLAAVVVWVAVVGLACSGDREVGPPLGSTATVGVADVGIDAAGGAQSGVELDVTGGQSVFGGDVLLLETFVCGIFDPAIDAANQPLTTDLRLVSEIHAGLTRIAESDSGYSVEPELASGWHSFDGATRFEFGLRPDLRFSDGSRLLASDVKWSWERALRNSVAGSRARTVLGGIVGAGEVAAGASQELEGVRVVDDTRLVVTLERADVDFPLGLTDPVAAVVKRDDVAAWDDGWQINPELPAIGYREEELPVAVLPVGAGPFRLVGYSTRAASDLAVASGADCVLRRNEHYWDSQAPRLDAVIARVAFDDWQSNGAANERRLQRMSNAEVDFVAAGEADDLPGLALGDWRVEPHALGSFTRFLVFNPDVPPFDSAAFRRALVRSYDTSRDLRQLETEVGRGIVPHGIGADRDAIVPLGFDPDAALSELAVAGFAALPSLGEHIAALGAYLQPDAEPFRSWQDILGLDTDVGASGVDPYPDPIGIAEVRVVPTSPSSASVLLAALNAFGADDRPAVFEDLHRELVDALGDVDEVRRAQRLLAVEQRLLDGAFAMPLQNLRNGATLVVQPWLHGLRFPQFHGSVFRDVWFSDDAPPRDVPVE